MLEIDSLTVADLDALESQRLLHLLNELYGEIKRIADAKKRAKTDEKTARVALLFSPADPKLKAQQIEAKALLDILGYELSARKEQTKILQTQLNTQSRLAR
jgi:hypothetical protein